MSLEIKTADELIDPALEARWAARRHGTQGELLRSILRAFAERGGPVPVSQVEAAFPRRPVGAVRDELAALDDQDLILLQEDEIRVAYPFSAIPTPFLVTFADGRERFACCATDALGIAAMLGARIGIRCRCHHCGEPLDLAVDATGPLDAGEIMVWMGKRQEGERRACTSL
jgi:Alkylmercury lyase